MARKERDETEEILVRLFGSTSRPRILGLLINHAQQAFYQREIVYETGLSLQAVQRELKNLLHLGVLKKREEKAKIYYQIDSSSPWFNPLKEIYTTYVQFLLSKKHPPHPNPPPLVRPGGSRRGGGRGGRGGDRRANQTIIQGRGCHDLHAD